MKWLAFVIFALFLGGAMVAAEANDRPSDRDDPGKQSDGDRREHQQDARREQARDAHREGADARDRADRPTITREHIGSSGDVTGQETISWNWTVSQGFRSLHLRLSVTESTLYQWQLESPDGTITTETAPLTDGEIFTLDHGAGELMEGTWELSLTLTGVASYDLGGGMAHVSHNSKE